MPRSALKAAESTPAPSPAPGRADDIWLPIPVQHLVPSPANPRRTFDEPALAELAESLAAHGCLENLIVRRKSDSENYIVVAGERRLRAAQILVKDGRWPKDAILPCRVVAAGDAEARVIALVENLQRADLAPLEEGEGYRALAAAGWKTGAIAEAIGKTQRHVQLRLALVEKLDPAVKKALAAGQIELAHARALTIAPPKVQKEKLKQIEDGWFETAEDLKGELTEDRPPVQGWPLFDPALYKGELIEDPDDPDVKFFADAAEAEKLQREAIAARIEKLKQTWAFVEVLKPGAHFASWDWKASKDKTKAGAVVEQRHGLQIEIHEGLVPADKEPVRAGRAGESPRANKSQPTELATLAHLEHARRRKTHALQTAVAGDGLVAQRLAIAGLLQGGEVKFASDPFGQADCDPRHPAHPPAPAAMAILKRLLPKIGIKLDKDDMLPEGYSLDLEPDELLAALWKLTAAETGELFAALVAVHVGSWSGHRGEWGDDEFPEALARRLGLAGTEAKHGLSLLPEDLEGLRKEPLEEIARSFGLEPGATAKATREEIETVIGAGEAKALVLPSFRFGPPDAVKKAFAEFVKTGAVAGLAAKPPRKAASPAKPKAKPKAKAKAKSRKKAA